MTESDDSSRRVRSKWLDSAYGEELAARRKSERELVESRWVRFIGPRGLISRLTVPDATSPGGTRSSIFSSVAFGVLSVVIVLMLVAIVISIGAWLFG